MILFFFFSYPGSSCLFSALLTKCVERNVFALCRCISRRNYPPRFVALVPQEEELDEGKVQTTPPGTTLPPHTRASGQWRAIIVISFPTGFNVIYLPYADDLRNLDPPQTPWASPTQVDKMREIVHKLRFKYRSGILSTTTDSILFFGGFFWIALMLDCIFFCGHPL